MGVGDPVSDLALQLEDVLKQINAAKGELAVGIEPKDGRYVLTIDIDSPPSAPDEKTVIETRKGTLELESDDPLAQAQHALEQASAGIEELKAINLDR